MKLNYKVNQIVPISGAANIYSHHGIPVWPLSAKCLGILVNKYSIAIHHGV